MAHPNLSCAFHTRAFYKCVYSLSCLGRNFLCVSADAHRPAYFPDPRDVDSTAFSGNLHLCDEEMELSMLFFLNGICPFAEFYSSRRQRTDGLGTDDHRLFNT